MEDYVYILDYLAAGTPGHRRESSAYGVGESQFTLLELLPRHDVSLVIGERVYVGKDKDKREKISKVKGRVTYDELTAAAHGELLYIIIDIVKDNEEQFVKFYNECPSISTRYHALELLPGLGKKTMREIVSERRKQPFESFEDIADRVTHLTHPEKLVAKRVEEELRDSDQKYRLFTRPPLKK
jgi:putative nucleotide binding protein